MCTVCGQVSGHNPRCPEYDSRENAVYICDKCGEGIHGGDKMLEHDGNKICADCITDMTCEELLNMLGTPLREVQAEEVYE